MPSTFPGSADVFKTIPTPTTTPTNLSDASDDTLSTRLQQHSDSINAVESYLLSSRAFNGFPIDSGSINNYVITLPSGTPSSYQDGMSSVWIPSHSNSSGSTLTVSPLGSVSLLNPAGIVLQGGELVANQPTLVVYKSSAPAGFRIVGPCLLSFGLSTSSASVVVECAGYTSVNVSMSFSGAGFGLNLAHLSRGVPVSALITNLSGSTTNMAIAATDPGGFSYIVSGVKAGSATGSSQVALGGGGISINNNSNFMFVGGASNGVLIFNF